MSLIQTFILTFNLDWGELEFVLKFHERKNGKIDLEDTGIYFGVVCPEFE